MKNLFKRKIRIIGTANEISGAADTLHIPYGQFTHARGLQIIGRDEAHRIVTSFNERGKALPFYIGHPDEASMFDKYRDHRAYGWITRITANEADIALTIDWTSEGRTMLENGMFKWWSPRFLNIARTTANEKRLHPFCLTSAGLTHNPNMDLEPAANEDEEQEEGEQMNELLQRLLSLIGREDVKTEDEAINYVTKAIASLDSTESAVNEMQAAGQAALDDVTAQLATANEALADSRKAHAGILLDMALTEGRITPSQRPGYETKFAAAFEATANELAAAQPVMHTASSVKDAARRDAKGRSIQEQIQSSVNEAMSDGLTYNAAFARVKKNSPELFQQPQDPRP